jgi:nucleotide-binding universal stress UspA family protein
VERFVAGTYTSVTVLRVAELPEQTVAGRVETPMPIAIVGSGPAVTTKTEPQLAETRGQAIRRVKKEVEAYLNETARSLRAEGIEVESAARLGHAAEEIIDYARTHDVDMIMMSTHGRTGLGKMFFGSVAGRVLLSGVKPVLLVRPDGLE